MLFIENGRMNFFAIFLVYIMPVIIVIVYYLMLKSTFKNPEDVAAKIRE
jgi:hypothetical protein